jgi:hypothetical protein
MKSSQESCPTRNVEERRDREGPFASWTAG